jgi:superfamily I DNA/RNA helicase
LWQLSHPRINADYIMLDEAQDTNPVLLDVFWRQGEHAQLVAVGDDCQAIYEWRGAVNALAELSDMGAVTTYLSQSFRFGPAVADVANDLLGRLNAQLRLTGTPTIPSVVGPITDADCHLTRTNAAAMRIVLEELGAGRRPHLVGGGAELVSFARAAAELMRGQRTYHPELACFDTWGEVQDYVAHDQQGDELRLMVGLMDEYGPERILEALDRCPREQDADVVVSTAHKSKGREWNRVVLGADFPDGELREVSDPELRLLYVAVTRAQRELDVTNVALLTKQPDEDEVALPPVYVAAPPIVEGVAEVSSGMIGSDAAPSTTLVADRACPKCGRTDVFTEDGAILYSSDHLC